MDNVKPMTTTGRQDLFTLAPRNLGEAMEYAKMISDTEMVPKDFRGKPGNVLVAVQMGAELGLPPMQALQNIAVINGRPSLWGDAVLALVTASAECMDVIESDDGNTATCTIKRRGKSDIVRTFSMTDAKQAGLAGKQGPWTQYPARMRQMRARSFAVRDAFPHLLRGIAVAEEVMDTPRDVTPQPAARTEIPAYPAEAFNRNFPTWETAIKSSKKTAAQIIATVQTKGVLSADQKKQIQDCEKPDDEPEQAEETDNAEWLGAYENAGSAEGEQQ